MLGVGIAKNNSLQTVAIHMSNINIVKNIEIFMKHFGENNSVQTLDLTDNDIGSTAGKMIVNMMKSQAEKKDVNQWSDNLRRPTTASAKRSKSVLKSIANETLNIVTDGKRRHGLVETKQLEEDSILDIKDQSLQAKGFKCLILR